MGQGRGGGGELVERQPVDEAGRHGGVVVDEVRCWEGGGRSRRGGSQYGRQRGGLKSLPSWTLQLLKLVDVFAITPKQGRYFRRGPCIWPSRHAGRMHRHCARDLVVETPRQGAAPSPRRPSTCVRSSVAATCVHCVPLSGFARRTARKARVHPSCPPVPLAFFPLVSLPRVPLPPRPCPWAAPSRTRRWRACKPSSAPRTPRRTSAPPSSVLKGMKTGRWTGCCRRPRGRRRAGVPAVREGG